MGASATPHCVFVSIKGDVEASINGSRLGSKKRRGQSIKRRRNGFQMVKRSHPAPRSLVRSRSTVRIERRVKTLKKLIPGSSAESAGLEGLFRDAADYILSLQMKVRAMQMMVNALTPGS